MFLVNFKCPDDNSKLRVFIDNVNQISASASSYKESLTYQSFATKCTKETVTLFCADSTTYNKFARSGFPVGKLLYNLDEINPYANHTTKTYICEDDPEIYLEIIPWRYGSGYDDTHPSYRLSLHGHAGAPYEVSVVSYPYNDTAPTGFSSSTPMVASLPNKQSSNLGYYRVYGSSASMLRWYYEKYYVRGYSNIWGSLSSASTDPYYDGGSSGGGGGTGDFDNTSDTIGLPSLPSLSGLNTGFFTAFVPSASQMQSVSNYLWNNALTNILDPDTGLGEKVDALKKIVANPYDAIMGCSIIPVKPPTAGSKELKMYGVLETGISLPYASSRWVEVDCGTLNIHEFWGGYLDYSPYTKTTSLYLPYIGTVSIDIDLIMAKALQVVYYVDILSGICVAFILVDGSVKFHYQGQCATQIPITNADYSSVISSGIGLIGNASQVVGSAVVGGVGGGVGGAVAGAVAGAISQAPSIASNVMGAKPDIRSGGAIGSSAGILSVQRPYLIIERPKQSVPAFQNHFTGYPSNITAKVSDLTGYTEFETINLDGLFLTDSEKKELEDILKGGVYL